MKKLKELFFITGNPAKAKYLSDYFHLPFEHRKMDTPEIQSLDLKEIVEAKAQKAYEMIRRPVLVEDVSLTFPALGKLPGPLIKWFLRELGNEGLCRLLDNYPSREAVAEVNFALGSEEGVKIFSGSRKGTVADQPRGETNFGWDPIFIPDGYNRTWAEMTADEKHETSMRRSALEELKKYLLS